MKKDEVRQVVENAERMMPGVKFYIMSKPGELDFFLAADTPEDAQAQFEELRGESGFTIREVDKEEFIVGLEKQAQ
jgi:hypothetical protein